MNVPEIYASPDCKKGERVNLYLLHKAWCEIESEAAGVVATLESLRRNGTGELVWSRQDQKRITQAV